MITQNSIALAVDMGRQAAAQNIKLSTCVETPLEQLCQSSILFSSDFIPTANDAEQQQSLEAFADETDNSSHNAQLDALVTQVATAVSTHLSFTRNVVLNNVKEYITRVAADASKFVVDPSSLFTLRMVQVPAPLTNPNVLDELKKVSGVMFLEPEQPVMLDSRGPKELSEFILTGNGAIDKDINTWVRMLPGGTDFLVQVWEDHFTDPLNNTRLNKSSFIECLSNPTNGMDVATAVYLFARALTVKDKLPDVAKETAAFNKTLDQYRDVAATTLLRHMAAYDKNKETAVVLVHFDRKNQTVYVNKNAYMDYLKQGGKTEAILGYMTSGVPSGVVLTSGYLLQKTPELLKEWDRFVAASGAETRNRKMNQFLSSLRTHFFILLQKREELEEDMFNNPSHLDAVSKQFESQLDGVNSGEMDNIEQVCLRLMTTARYFYTPSYQILQDMAAIAKEHPDMDVEEAAMMATINYVTDYIADQITTA